MLAPFSLGVIASAIRVAAGGSTSYDPYFANVVLLLHADGTNGSTTFTDSSLAAKTLTAFGGAKISTSLPKFGTGSLSFDGTDDYITTTTVPADFRFGTGDFTIETFVKTTKNQSVLLDFYATGVANGWQVYLNSPGYLSFWTHTGSSSLEVAAGSSNSVTNGAWRHVAVCRASGTTRLFVDGAQVASVADTRDYNATGVTQLTLGAQLNTRFSAGDLNGYLDEVRITKGVARYTTTFTPAIAPFPSAQQSNLLLHFNGANGSTTLTDSSTDARTVTPSGTAQLSTTQKKFGTASLALDGSAGCYADFTPPALSGDFTVEAWVYTTTLGVSRDVISFQGAFLLYLWSGNKIGLYRNVGGGTQGTTTIAANTWYHFALCRQGSTIRLFLNGNLEATVTDSTAWTPASARIGAYTDGSERWTGYIDEVRIIAGVAAYTAAFTAPASEFA